MRYKKIILENEKKFFLFDWDDNILVMPTKILLDRKTKIGWIPVKVDSEEFRDVRKKIGTEFRLRPDSFNQFKDSKQFEIDLLSALENKNFGPSFEKFINVLINGDDFAIITARGHSPNVIKDGIKVLITHYFTPQEIKSMIKNLGGESIGKYLSRQKYRTVSSQEFSDEFNLGVGSQSPEMGKKIALTDYIHNVVKATNKLVNDDKYTKISVGFSDDDLGNIKAVEEIIREELYKKFPDINFVIYDTSDPKNIKKKRIFIEK
jgi:hypothetical protein